MAQAYDDLALLAALEEPAMLRAVLGEFSGQYSIGIDVDAASGERRVRVVSPFLDDGYHGYDSDCWTSQRVRTRTGWRYRSVWACY